MWPNPERKTLAAHNVTLSKTKGILIAATDASPELGDAPRYLVSRTAHRRRRNRTKTVNVTGVPA